MSRLDFYFNRMWFSILGALTLFPILPRGLESTLMITIAILSIVCYWRRTKHNRPHLPFKNITVIVLLSAVFLVYLISLMYSSNIKEGMDQTLRVVPLVLFPVVFGWLGKDMVGSKELDRLKIIYLFAIGLGLLIIHFLLFENFYCADLSHWDIRQLIERTTGVHGTYLSLWIGFGVLIVLSKMPENHNFNNIGKITGHLILIGYFVYWQITIGARMPMMTTLFLSFLFVVIRLRSRGRIFVILIFLAITTTFLMFSKSNILERLENVFSFEHTFPEGDYSYKFRDISSEDIRKGIFLCAWTKFKESPWTGYGIGDVQDHMDNCYIENISSNVYQRFHYNTHNQYLQVALAGGVFALALFLLSIWASLYVSLKSKDTLFFSFNILVMACFFTENIISRHDGVIFYGLFNSALFFNSLRKAKKT